MDFSKVKALEQAGFALVEEHPFWETRRVYKNLQELCEDLLARTGRSLLHDLTDEELRELVQEIQAQVTTQTTENTIVEQDHWTIWKAQKGTRS